MAASSSWDDGYRQRQASHAHAELMGEGLPAAIEPYSFVPWEGLRELTGALAMTPGQTLVDLGCGRGGPGLWLAGQTGARLIGVDGSGVAVADARQRQGSFSGVSQAQFITADVTRTGLSDACADAVISIDVLQLLDDQAAMIREAARLVRPTGRIVLTTWEGWGPAPERFPRDLRALIEDAGLRVGEYVERPAWLARQFRIYQRAAAIATSADPAVADLAEEGRRSQRWRNHVRRVVLTAHHAR